MAVRVIPSSCVSVNPMASEAMAYSRSSEVWKVLSAAKLEFQKYGQVWEKLGKQLETAQNTVSEAGRRTRAVERKLKDVETFEISELTP